MLTLTDAFQNCLKCCILGKNLGSGDQDSEVHSDQDGYDMPLNGNLPESQQSAPQIQGWGLSYTVYSIPGHLKPMYVTPLGNRVFVATVRLK